MDYLTFFAVLIKSAAWPAAIITIALIFRHDLRQLFARVRKGKLGFAEFEFEQGVSELAAEAVTELTPTAISNPDIELATSNPRAAIIENWLQLENSARQLVNRNSPNSTTSIQNSISLVRVLRKINSLPPEDISLFNELRMLRNQATHDLDFNPSPESVITYVKLAQNLKSRINTTALIGG